MELTCLIIDDEPLARERLFNLTRDIKEFNVLDLCKTGREALNKIKLLKPDFIFLDIQMKDMTGFDVLKNLDHSERPLVIFVTAYDKYAVMAFDNYALDYLLKPFKKERFLETTNRIIHHFKKENQSDLYFKIDELMKNFESVKQEGNKKVSEEKIKIRIGNTTSFVKTNEIYYILASGSYADIFTTKKTHVVRSSLNDLETNTRNTSLIRIHRSAIINIDYLDKIISSGFGEIDVKMMDGKLFRVSKTYKKEFQKKIKL
jgi:two-component system LytT family response regulator